MGSDWGDVLFAAEEYYRPIVRKRVDRAYWPVMKRWINRVDNWCHADVLSWTYSRLLEANPTTVMPVLEQWNVDAALWPRRVSRVSLIHYSGKNAVFLTPDEVLPWWTAASRIAVNPCRRPSAGCCARCGARTP